MYDWFITVRPVITTRPDQTFLHVDDQASNTHEIASDQKRCICINEVEEVRNLNASNVNSQKHRSAKSNCSGPVGTAIGLGRNSNGWLKTLSHFQW